MAAAASGTSVGGVRLVVVETVEQHLHVVPASGVVADLRVECVRVRLVSDYQVPALVRRGGENRRRPDDFVVEEELGEAFTATMPAAIQIVAAPAQESEPTGTRLTKSPSPSGLKVGRAAIPSIVDTTEPFSTMASIGDSRELA